MAQKLKLGDQSHRSHITIIGSLYYRYTIKTP